MTTSMDALIRAIDALGKHGLADEWPQVATEESPVATAKSMEKQACSHTGHAGHSQRVHYGKHHGHAARNASIAEHERGEAPLNIYSLGVATVATVAIDIDSKGETSGHTPESCGQSVATARLSADLGSTGLPSRWLEGVARLTTMAPPRSYPAHAWQQLITDAERFLAEWAQQAAALGWPAWELLGCHRRAPWGRIDGMGLVLLLHGDQLAALTAREAVIRRASGAHQTWRRKAADPLHPAERCLVWELA
jgi:hypothetical protein